MDTGTIISHTKPQLHLTKSLASEVPQPGPNHWLQQLDLSSPKTQTESMPLQVQMPRVMQIPQQPLPGAPTPEPRQDAPNDGFSTVLLIFIPIMVVILTVLLGLVVFLVTVLYLRRKKGIKLTEDGGPLDLGKGNGDGVIGEGGVEGVEARWLEGVEPDVREAYRKAKDWQSQYPPTSIPTDITLSQFLSIQEKGVSAWAFEPDYEDNLSLYVQSRTELTFLSDGPGMPAREGGGNSVMANLPLPKLNEVYYWECKMYEKAPTTEVAIGLATKPYPSFRLPGWNKFSVAYFASDGFKSHNYPFTASSYGPPLAEGDVLGVGYRPRTGTVFFTRNGRKMDDAYTGLQRWNLFPIVGANGPCTIHVNLGQAGFVFIEANVKKWGLAPMVGTLAPPPAYGSERGSILLDAGYGTPNAGHGMALLEAARGGREGAGVGFNSGSPRSSNGSRRHRRAGRTVNLAQPSPLRRSEAGPGPATAGSRRRALGRDYVSPTDTPAIATRVPPDDLEEVVSEEGEGGDSDSVYDSASSGSAMEPNPPTPNLLDISLHSLRASRGYFGGREEEGSSGSGSEETVRPGHGASTADSARNIHQGRGQSQSQAQVSPPPPNYAPLDPNVYSGGLPTDLPDDLINQAIASMTEPAPPAPSTPTPAPRGRLAGWLGLGGSGSSTSSS